MIRGMNHFTITAEDRAQTLDYYCGLGLARTDNSGWGDEFEKLTERLIEDKR